MSFFTITCPWCGTRYTTGIVGRTPVGSGHTCTATLECDSCSEPGVFAVRDHFSSEPITSFACGEHIGNRMVVQTQMRDPA